MAIFIHFCLCDFVCICVRSHAYMCMPMCVHILVEARAALMLSPQLLPVFFVGSRVFH